MSNANWAIVIGVDRYWDASACLKSAVRDALRMREWLLDRSGGNVRNTHLRLLLAPLPSSELPLDLECLLADSDSIVGVIEDVARKNKGTTIGERLFFYYAGHGLTTRINFSNEPAVIPSDFTSDHPDKALMLRSLVEYLETTHIPEQFFFIDGCRNFPRVGGELQIRGMPRPQKLDPDLPAPQQFIFYATSPGAKAAEIQQAANERGAFTDALVRGLQGDRKARQWDDTSEKYLVTVNSLFDFISAEVAEVLRTAGDGAHLIQVPRLGGERGAAGKRANNPGLAVFDVSLPTPDPKRFSIALVHLEKDENGELEKFIVDALGGFEGVEVLRFDRPILLEGIQPEDRERTGRERALKLLTESGADVLVWGSKLELNGKIAARLYWTTSAASRRPKSPYVPDNNNFKLPEIFWSDLVDVLRLLVVIQGAEFFALKGHFLADRLGPFVDKVRSLANADKTQEGWTAETRTDLNFIFALGVASLGQQTGKSEYLEEAIAAFCAVLQKWTRDQVPLDWAMTQGNLGIAHKLLGELDLRTVGQKRGAGKQHLHKAIDAFHAALEEHTRDRAPQEWARTQNNLGNALTRLGEIEKRPGPLKEAIRVFDAARDEWSRVRSPLRWATVQHNLGVALAKLGEIAGMSHLQKAIDAFRDALQERTSDLVPRDWAMTQLNLGNALHVLGKRKKNITLLCEALERHIDAWRFLASTEPHAALDASSGALADIDILAKRFPQTAYEVCITRHQQALEQLIEFHKRTAPML
jgi:tetratricopeptide (TPR) repeat protein